MRRFSPTAKRIVTLALASEFGTIIKKSINTPATREKYFSACTDQEIDLILWNCDEISNAGKVAFYLLTKHINLDKSLLRACEKKVTEAVKPIEGPDVDMVRLLSFLWTSLMDIDHYMTDRTDNQPGKAALGKLIDAVRGFITVWDPNISDDDTHAAALQDYEKWGQS